MLRRLCKAHCIPQSSKHVRCHTTKQLLSPSISPIEHITHELKSKFQHVNLAEPTLQFKIMCVCTGLTITGSSIVFLREKLLFGTIGGITAKTLTAPLERLTVFRQASVDFTSSIALVIKEIAHTEGIKGFYRGNGINVFRASIQKGSLFALQDVFRELLTFGEREKLKQSLTFSFIAGWAAGLTSTFITYPMDTIKTVNQTTIHQRRWPAMQVWYLLARRRGLFRGPWIGALPTCIGASVYYAVKFMTFDACIMGIGILSDRYDFELQKDIQHVVAGLCAGVIGNATTYPNNCIRKRLQTSYVCDVLNVKSAYQPQNYLRTAQHMYFNEGGLLRFYRGFGLNLLRNAPNTAIQFLVYKRLKEYMAVEQTKTKAD